MSRPRKPRGGRFTKKRTCEGCRKYSRKTFYCAKHGKVLPMNREACNDFQPRKKRIPRGRKRYYY